MIRAALLALVLAFGGGVYFGLLLDVATTKAGSHVDPDGTPANGDTGSTLDPNGTSANGDLGTSLDPNG